MACFFTVLSDASIMMAISGLVFVSGLAVSTYLHGMLAFGSGLAASVVLLALLFRPWRAGGIGGGDVKLAVFIGLIHSLLTRRTGPAPAIRNA